MLEWLDARANLLEVIEEHTDAVSVLGVHRDEERGAKERLLAELVSLAIESTTLEKDALSMILERAGDEQRTREVEAQSKAQLVEDIQEAMLWTLIVGGCMALLVLVWKIGILRILTQSARWLWLSLKTRSMVRLSEHERQPLKTPLFLAPSAVVGAVIVRANLIEWFS